MGGPLLCRLRGHAGERQILGARTAIVATGGITPSNALIPQRDGS